MVRVVRQTPGEVSPESVRRIAQLHTEKWKEVCVCVCVCVCERERERERGRERERERECVIYLLNKLSCLSSSGGS